MSRHFVSVPCMPRRPALSSPSSPPPWSAPSSAPLPWQTGTFSLITMSTLKYQQETEDYEVPGWKPVTDLPQNLLEDTSWNSYILFTLVTNYTRLSKLNFMGVVTRKLESHRVAESLQSKWYPRSSTSKFDKIKSSLLFQNITKTFH